VENRDLKRLQQRKLVKIILFVMMTIAIALSLISIGFNLSVVGLINDYPREALVQQNIAHLALVGAIGIGGTAFILMFMMLRDKVNAVGKSEKP
jgi:hypothetical protein